MAVCFTAAFGQKAAVERTQPGTSSGSVKGQAKTAAVAWAAMKRAGLVPRSG